MLHPVQRNVRLLRNRAFMSFRSLAYFNTRSLLTYRPSLPGGWHPKCRDNSQRKTPGNIQSGVEKEGMR